MLSEIIARDVALFYFVLKGACGNGLNTWNVREICFEAIPVKDMGLV